MGRFDDRATSPSRGFGDILRWRVVDALAGKNRKDPGGFTPPFRAYDAPLVASGEPSLTWLGHASFLLALGGRRVLFDPMLAPRIGPVRRLVPPGIPLEALPPIDVVAVTHNHRDHLDPWTIERLAKREHPTTFVVPVGNGRLVGELGARDVVELDWWASAEVSGLGVTCVPARHWSMRFPWDKNDMLWSGFVVRGPEGAAYHSGDTAFFDTFAEIGERAGPIDWAMLPIGAYEPRWFMEPQHMDPEEAVRAAGLLRARRMVAMHWGTFKLTDEPLAEPPERARAAWRATGRPEEDLWILDIGETRRLG